MPSLLTYTWNALRHRKISDFVEMGYGIDARYLRCQSFWQKHLCNSIQFQKDANLREMNLSSIAVLGAGSLYDVDAKYLMDSFNQIDLYDANKSLKNLWNKRFPANNHNSIIRFIFEDLTFTMEKWTVLLNEFVKGNKHWGEQGFIEFLNGLQTNDCFDRLERRDLVISLNLLSQIPIYWRDRLSACLKRGYHIDSDAHGAYGETLDEAIRSTMRKLQEQHLRLLSAMNPKALVMIYDKYFLYYKSNNSLWQEEPAIFIDQDSFTIDNYKEFRNDQWLWHIAPQGIENDEYGVIHDVRASLFLRTTN